MSDSEVDWQSLPERIFHSKGDNCIYVCHKGLTVKSRLRKSALASLSMDFLLTHPVTLNHLCPTSGNRVRVSCVTAS